MNIPTNHRLREQFAKRIARLITTNGLSIAEFARRVTKAGYPITTAGAHHWLTGSLPPLDAVPAIAKALKLKKPGDLLPKRF